MDIRELTYEKAQKELIKLIRSMKGKYNVYDIYHDFITLAACAISNKVDIRQFDKREKMYMDTIAKYDKKEAAKFINMMQVTRQGLASGQLGDFIGETYMQLELGNKDMGQYFTPYDISRLMAAMLDFEENNDGLITINEPTCGSGGMIIAYAEQLKLKNINYHKKMRVVCQDIDHDVVKMCYVQLSLLGIDAVVMQGNTLTMQMNEYWYTPMRLVNMIDDAKKKDQENDEMKDIIKKIGTVEAEQSTIYDFL